MQKADVIIYGDSSNLLQELLDWCSSKGYEMRANHGREWTGVELDAKGNETNHGTLTQTYEKVEEKNPETEETTIVSKLVTR